MVMLYYINMSHAHVTTLCITLNRYANLKLCECLNYELDGACIMRHYYNILCSIYISQSDYN